VAVSKPILAVCGDSFHCDDPGFPGIHWTNFVSDKYDVRTFAFPGATNVHILDQVLQANKLNPSAIFVGFTGFDRIELEGNAADTKWPMSSMWSFWMTDEQNLLNKLTQCCVPMKFRFLSQFAVITETIHHAKKAPAMVYSNNMAEVCFKLILQIMPSFSARVNDVTSDSMKINLANYPHCDPPPAGPWFHIMDKEVQQKFAAEVLDKLKGTECPLY
jgi:hypothetical protein